MTPKLILVLGLPCNGGEDVDKVSCAMKAQLQCLPMPEMATSAGECPSGLGMGPRGGYSRVLCLQTVLSSRPMEEAAQLCCSNSCLGMLRGTVVVVTVALGVRRVVTLEKTKPRPGRLCGAETWGSALQLFSTFGAGVQPGTGLDACECHVGRHQTAERPQRNREHQDAGVLLMPAPTCSQSTGGKGELLSSGAVQGPLKLATPSCGFQLGCWGSGAGRVLALMWFL